MNTLPLIEHGDAVSFTPSAEELRVLNRHREFLEISQSGSEFRIRGKGDAVGTLMLSPQTQVIITPKCGIQSLLELILLASDSGVFPDLPELGRFERGNVIDWLAIMIVLEIQRLLSYGLRRGYISKTEKLGLIRGRIDFAKSFILGDSAQLTCRYEPFSIDTPENRILVAALDCLSRVRLAPLVKRRVADTLAIFARVSVLQLSKAMFENVRLTRLNQQYEAAIQLCRTLAEGAGVEFAGSSMPGIAFFISMNRIFERALLHGLRKRLPCVASQRSLRPFQAQLGTPDIPVSIAPDYTVLRGGRPAVVIDAKYKNPIQLGRYGETFDNANIYQIVTYAKALHCPGVLVYPQYDRPIDVTLRLDEVEVRLLSVDLSFNALKAIDSFSSKIESYTSQRLSA